nr:hypothetical protein [Tanacetum cinerariifolium]
MYTSKDNYLINFLRFVSAKESNQIYGAIFGNDEDDINDDNDLENEGKDEDNKSVDDKTPSDSEKVSDSEQDTSGSKSDSEFDQQERIMSSITAQQTKLDLKLVRNENRLDIRKFNGRIPYGLTPREPTFQVVMDAIALTPCYFAFLITAGVPKVYIHQFWNSVVPGRNFDALPSEEDIVSFLRELGHTGEINSLNNSLKMKNLSQKENELRSVKKSLTKPTTIIVIREPPVETKSKRKEKVDVTRGKGIELLSEVALTEEAQMKEVRKKSFRDFHKIHPSGSGMVIKNNQELIRSHLLSQGNDEDDINDDNDSENEGKDEDNKSVDDKTPSDSEKVSDSKQDTSGSKSDSEFDQQDINLASAALSNSSNFAWQH